MIRSDGGRDLADGLDAVAALARGASPPMTPLQRMRGLQAVTRRREARQHRRRTLFVATTLAAGGIAAAVILGPLALRGPHGRTSESNEASPLAYSVDHGEIGDGGYLRASGGGGGSGVGLRFAEGTELRLAAGARGRLTSVDAQGARFAIEQGQAAINVAPRPGARWLIDAGPFLITVHGTIFTASWDGASERLDISMKHGLVSVSGPVADGKIAVHAGQRLTINVPEREVLLRPSEARNGEADESDQARDDEAGGNTAAEAAAAAPAVEAPAPEAPPPTGTRTGTRLPAVGAPRSASPRAPSAGIGVRAGAPGRSWTAALAAGDFHGILREAEHRGLRRSLAEANSEDLAALADAARYLRREDVAREALVAQRERFPRSDRAREAAFLLGRLSESAPEGSEGQGQSQGQFRGQLRGDIRALTWYDRYLAEAPTGAYASEALGRKMTATEKMRGLAAARDIAREYLRRFPHGTYAGAARALSEAP